MRQGYTPSHFLRKTKHDFLRSCVFDFPGVYQASRSAHASRASPAVCSVVDPSPPSLWTPSPLPIPLPPSADHVVSAVPAWALADILEASTIDAAPGAVHRPGDPFVASWYPPLTQLLFKLMAPSKGGGRGREPSSQLVINSQPFPPQPHPTLLLNLLDREGGTNQPFFSPAGSEGVLCAFPPLRSIRRARPHCVHQTKPTPNQFAGA